MKIDDLITRETSVIGISGHMTPDGDCVGSCMALCLYLRKNYPHIRTDVFLETVPKELCIIPESGTIRTDFKTDVACYDLFFVLDSAKDRILDAEAFFDAAKKRVNIDHHVSNSGCGDINVMAPEASSACEVLAGLLDFEKMDDAVAMALYIGIVTDTGVFHYPSTSPDTMRLAARLMEFSFDHSDVIEHVQLERTYPQHRALGMMLAEARLALDGKVITACMDKQRMDEEHLCKEDLDQIASHLTLTAGVECAVFVYDTADLRKKVSLRSKKTVDVAEIAAFFGGGGHIRAAGFTTDGSADEVIERILERIKPALRERAK